MIRKARFSFLIPLDYGDDGSQIPQAKFQELLSELDSDLRKQFPDEGYTFYHNKENPLKGIYIAPNGQIVEDRNMLFMIWTAKVNEGRDFFKKYKITLMSKFRQNLVEIVEETIEVI